ncbi:serine hydrolase domain-containing protein [Xanthovirga aplysinae]|uniref:serine hydrolase domain-containing protein n=1 Tax=Xanthovirga aplysinae TaxID=2529853 RepID=UPI0012BC7E98|nr:serine hydrolase domain-containing protein [Xanthovirga aplysinae]MTI31188.1 class A beta-lactamase-related serine hydrolase [Xanthovirga aplysinae]
MNKFKILTLILLVLGCSTRTESEKEITPDYFDKFKDYEGFSLEQKREFHQKFEYDFNQWLTGGGGDFSRYIFLNMSEFFFNTTLNPDAIFKELPIKINENIKSFQVDSELGSMTLKQYISKSPVDGLIILHRGAIVLEEYPRMLWNDKHIWFSVSKTLVGTAIAILEDQDKVNTSEPISNYLREFENTEWEKVSVRDILDMASGMDVVETFSEDEKSNFLLFYDNFGFANLKAKSKTPIEFLKSIKSIKPSGREFQYSSVNTEILAWLVEEVTEESFSKFIEKEIWQKAGPRFEGSLITTSNGDCFSAGGMNSTLRDLARFGLLFVPSGRENEKLISDTYLENIQAGYNKSLATKSLFSEEIKNNSYQWDEIYSNGDFMKLGNNGQGLYISTSLDLVIAFFGTADEQGSWNELPLISRQLVNSELFRE